VLNAGGARTFHAVAYDASGNQIAYVGAVTFAVTGITGATATASSGSTTTVVVTGASSQAAGSGTLTAAIGSTTCTPAALSAFAPPAPSTLRVTVADQLSGAAITNATVIDGSGKTLTSGADGTYTESVSNPAAKNSFTAFAAGYGYVTVVDTGATDVFIPLKSTAAPGKLVGNLTNADFNNLSIPTGTVHIDISGSSIPGNLIDLSLTTLLGASVPTMINLGGTTATNVNLPDGIAIGLGPTMFKGNYSALATPGVRSFWSLGGNITLQIVLNAVSMASGGSVDIGAILTSVLPVLGELESGVTGGVTVSAGEAGTLSTTGTTSGTNAVLALNTLMRLHLSATVPNLPSYYLPTDVPGTPTGQLNAAIVLGGVLASPQGFVPLGLTAGVNDTANNKPSQIGGYMGGPDGIIPLRIAPRSGGLEGSPYLAIALAADLSSLTSGFGDGSGSSSSSSKPLVLSGNVMLPGELKYNNGATTSITFPGDHADTPSFLGVPAQPTISVATRQLSMPATDVPHVAFHRLDIGSAPNDWEIYFPAGETVVSVPALPNGFTGPDYLVPAAGSPSINLQSVTLGLNGDNSGKTYTYDGVLSFQAAGGPTVDDLTLQIDQFSVEGISLTASN
jgi:hypothetical protein